MTKKIKRKMVQLFLFLLTRYIWCENKENLVHVINLDYCCLKTLSVILELQLYTNIILIKNSRQNCSTKNVYRYGCLEPATQAARRLLLEIQPLTRQCTLWDTPAGGKELACSSYRTNNSQTTGSICYCLATKQGMNVSSVGSKIHFACVMHFKFANLHHFTVVWRLHMNISLFIIILWTSFASTHTLSFQ